MYTELTKLMVSRSPRGVLLALRNAASFYRDGKIVNVAGPGKHSARAITPLCSWPYPFCYKY